jgi:hypothetical protein
MTPNSIFPSMKAGAMMSAGMIWISQLYPVVKNPTLRFRRVATDRRPAVAQMSWIGDNLA